MDRDPELAFGVSIQILPKPLFKSFLARTVRRKTEIPKLSATGEDELEAIERIRTELRKELDGLRTELRSRIEQADEQELLEIIELLLAVAPAEGLRAILSTK